MKKWLGIDPGKAGGLAVVDHDGTACAMPMPYVGTMVDVAKVIEFARGEDGYPPTGVALERQQGGSFHGKRISPVTMFTMGVGYGQLIACLQVIGWRWTTVNPKAWQKVILGAPTSDKTVGVEYCARVYPQLDLAPGKKRVADKGMSDATCIADWARLHSPFKQ